MHCGVVMDPLEAINPKKDTSLALMLEAQAQGFAIEYFNPGAMTYQGNRIMAFSTPIEVFDNSSLWFRPLTKPRMISLTVLDLILMRQDPPVDFDYLYVTYMLEAIAAQGVPIINHPAGVRAINEKLFCLNFPGCIPKTEVSANISELKRFIQTQQIAIVKPLWGMGGEGIYKLTIDDPNINIILEGLTHQGKTPIIAQQYLPEIKHGDKRVILINGEAYPYALSRLAADGETRANLAAGGQAKGAQLTEQERWVAQQVGPTLKARGIVFAGLDIIGGYLTEINVTSPTCVRQIEACFNVNLCRDILAAGLSQA